MEKHLETLVINDKDITTNLTLNSIMEFCVFAGFPGILQTDNIVEYFNQLLIEDFCSENYIKHIKGSSWHLKKNEIVKITHKEFRKLFKNFIQIKMPILKIVYWRL